MTVSSKTMKVYTLLLTEGEINSLKDRLESDNYVNYDNDLKSVVEKIGYFFEPENTYNDIPKRY